MSNWTHVTGCLYVETYKERKNIKKYVEKMLVKAPKITGSEGNLDIFVNPLSGYNVSSYKTDKNGDWLHYQTCVVITMVGDLRDTEIKYKKPEILEFLKYIEKFLEFNIFYHSISIYEDYTGKKETIDWKGEDYHTED